MLLFTAEREMGRPHAELARYYRSEDVRARIAQYCGGTLGSPKSFGAWDIAGYGGRRRLSEPDGAPVRAANAELTQLLEDGADVCRSLADRGGALLQLDVDYVTPADPGEAYRDPETCFRRLEPVHRAVMDILAGYGIAPLVLMTGRGYHYSVRVPLESCFHEALVEIGSIGEALRARYERHAGETGVLMGRAHEGAGRLFEHLAHRVLRRLGRLTEVPVALADVPVPGGAFICLDLTAYADPLFERHARCAFSGNQKASMKAVAPERPFAICLPRDRRSVSALLEAREDVAMAASLAAEEAAAIPEVAGEDLAWVNEYRRSGLAAFHKEFERGSRMEPEDWPFTYDALGPEGLPACVALALEFPNPLLLSPAYLRTVALALWGLGWHPRSVAGIIRSKYERDHAWGSLWRRYEPEARAEFYVRLFCGAVAEGLERGEAFSCESQRLRGVCESPGCGWELRGLFEGLARRWGRAS